MNDTINRESDNLYDGSIVKTVETVLARITQHEPELNAVAERIDDIAYADAHRCDALRAAGALSGPLHGVPFAVKDIIDVAGAVTRSGSLTQTDNDAASLDATVVTALRAAGAVPVVKTNTVEFAIGGWGTNETAGTPVNPWLPTVQHVPGGSSSGTGVLVGAGILPAGLGTDTGGSVRIPASFCGCVGLKTSIGSVSRAGVTPLSETLDTVGPLAGNVTLAAQMFEAMQGCCARDATTLDNPGDLSIRELTRGNQGMRLGVISENTLTDLNDDVRESFRKSQQLLEDSGAVLASCELPMSFSEYQRLAGLISASEAYASYHAFADDPDAALAQPNRERILAGKSVSAAELVQIRRKRDEDIAEFESIIDGFDAIILPSTPTTAIPVADIDEKDFRCSLYTRMANYLGLAALSLPIELTTTGLPTSLQIVVRRFDDARALRIGAAFEAARGVFPAAYYQA